LSRAATDTASRRAPLVAPAVALLLVVAAAMAPFDSHGLLFWGALLDAGHYFAFFALTIVLRHAAVRRGAGPLAASIVAGVTAVLLTVAIEWLQPLVGRDSSTLDLWLGWLGVLAGIGGAHAWRPGAPRFVRLPAVVLIALVGALALLPALAGARTLAWRRASFPLLADFEAAAERPLWSVREGASTIAFTDRRASSGARALEIRIPPGGRGSVGYLAGLADWRPFETFAFDAFDPGEPFVLTVIAIDRSRRADLAGRFTGRYRLESGWNEIRVPIDDMRSPDPDAELDTGAIWRLLFVAWADDAQERVFYLDHLRLEDGAPPP
jgi:hypothetical protein